MMFTIGALIFRIGFWGPLYYKYYKEPPKIVSAIIKAPILAAFPFHQLSNKAS